MVVEIGIKYYQQKPLCMWATEKLHTRDTTTNWPKGGIRFMNLFPFFCSSSSIEMSSTNRFKRRSLPMLHSLHCPLILDSSIWLENLHRPTFVIHTQKKIRKPEREFEIELIMKRIVNNVVYLYIFCMLFKFFFYSILGVGRKTNQLNDLRRIVYNLYMNMIDK